MLYFDLLKWGFMFVLTQIWNSHTLRLKTLFDCLLTAQLGLATKGWQAGASLGAIAVSRCYRAGEPGWVSISPLGVGV